jgi:tetrahydromethanopterin S-methyltransferase subunit G
LAEVTNELMFELMKRMHERFDKVDHTLSEVKHELNAMRGHMVAMSSDIANIYSILGRHDDRLDRIERRLELREFAEPPAPYTPG